MSANLPVECHFSSWHRRGWRKFDGIPPPLHTCTHKSIYRGKERKEGGGGEGGREREGEEREGEEREGEGGGGGPYRNRSGPVPLLGAVHVRTSDTLS